MNEIEDGRIVEEVWIRSLSEPCLLNPNRLCECITFRSPPLKGIVRCGSLQRIESGSKVVGGHYGGNTNLGENTYRPIIPFPKVHCPKRM